MNKLKKRKKPGFTLIEMVVVIAIVVIVAAIAIPQALKAVNKAKASTDIANARTYAGEIMNRVADGEDIKDTTAALPIADAAESKLKKGEKFFYELKDDKITISIGKSATEKKEVYPNADSDWAKYVSKEETKKDDKGTAGGEGTAGTE